MGMTNPIPQSDWPQTVDMLHGLFPNATWTTDLQLLWKRRLCHLDQQRVRAAIEAERIAHRFHNPDLGSVIRRMQVACERSATDMIAEARHEAEAQDADCKRTRAAVLKRLQCDEPWFVRFARSNFVGRHPWVVDLTGNVFANDPADWPALARDGIADLLDGRAEAGAYASA